MASKTPAEAAPSNEADSFFSIEERHVPDNNIGHFVTSDPEYQELLNNPTRSSVHLNLWTPGEDYAFPVASR